MVHLQARNATSSGERLLAPRQAPDRRADGQARTVSLSRDIVRIDRRLNGIAMQLAVPVSHYKGVALALEPDQNGSLAYKLHLLHDDGELSVILDEAADDSDILADWRLWSRFFRLPALVERQAGFLETADLTLGAVQLGTGSELRRRPRAGLKRRPRFLQRRKAGQVAAIATTFAGEREIIART